MTAPPMRTHLPPLASRTKLEELVLKEVKGDYSVLTLNRAKVLCLALSLWFSARDTASAPLSPTALSLR
jgi:hypothetical protein